MLTSLSRDGEYIARVIRRFGFVPVRGSSSRGGQRGLMEIDTLVDGGSACLHHRRPARAAPRRQEEDQ